jgi:hypothetical protein
VSNPITSVDRFSALYRTSELEVYVPTTGEWYGTYTIPFPRWDKFVRLSLVIYPKCGDKMCKVSLWGNDDCGLEREFTSYAEAHRFFSVLATSGPIPGPVDCVRLFEMKRG